LYFDDVVEGPGVATPADIEALCSFGVEWLAEVRKHPSSTVVHCGAGISRSAASALFLLVLYFENYVAAATHLFENRHERTESERFKCFPYDELLKRDKVNLDIFWLKDEWLEDSANLPDPNVLALEIAEELEAALEQFAAIAEDLKR
jgi:hypothetical protein